MHMYLSIYSFMYTYVCIYLYMYISVCRYILVSMYNAYSLWCVSPLSYYNSKGEREPWTRPKLLASFFVEYIYMHMLLSIYSFMYKYVCIYLYMYISICRYILVSMYTAYSLWCVSPLRYYNSKGEREPWTRPTLLASFFVEYIYICICCYLSIIHVYVYMCLLGITLWPFAGTTTLGGNESPGRDPSCSPPSSWTSRTRHTTPSHGQETTPPLSPPRYVYVNVFMYLYVYIYIYIYKHYIYLYLYIFIFSCVCVYMHIHTHTTPSHGQETTPPLSLPRYVYVNVFMYLYVYIYIYIYIYKHSIYLYLYIFIFSCVCVHIYTYAHYAFPRPGDYAAAFATGVFREIYIYR